MSFVTLAEYATLTVGVLLTFTLIGLPFRLLLDAVAGTSVRVPAQMIGMGVVVVLSWYWYGAIGGTTTPIRVLVAIGAIAAIVVAIRRPHSVRAAMKEMVLPGAVALTAALVLTVLFGSVLSESVATVVTGGNNDVVAYAVLAQHIADDSLDDPGSILGFDAGVRAQSDFDFGIMAISAASGAAGPFRDVWRYQLPLLAVAIGQLASILAHLLDDLAPRRRILTVVAATAGISTFLFTYLWSQYFLNQIVAMGLMIAAALTIARSIEGRSLRRVTGFGLAAAVLMAPLIASYPHLGLIGTAVVAPPLILASGTSDLAKKAIWALGAGTGVVIAGAMLLPTPTLRVLDSIRYLDSVDAGWPLPGFLPAEILGLLNNEEPRHDSIFEWFPSAVIMIAVFAAAIILVRKQVAPRMGWFTIVFVPLVFASYGAIYLREGGPTYQQWKWITSFVPIITATVVMTLLLATQWALTRVITQERARAVTIAIGVGLVTVAMTNSLATGFPLGTAEDRIARLELDTVALKGNPAIESIDDLTIDAGPYWETMWIAYFLRDTPTLRLLQPSYFPIAPSRSTWVLQSTTQPVPDDASSVLDLNESYRLVRVDSG